MLSPHQSIACFSKGKDKHFQTCLLSHFFVPFSLMNFGYSPSFTRPGLFPWLEENAVFVLLCKTCIFHLCICVFLYLCIFVFGCSPSLTLAGLFPWLEENFVRITEITRASEPLPACQYNYQRRGSLLIHHTDNWATRLSIFKRTTLPKTIIVQVFSFIILQ